MNEHQRETAFLKRLIGYDNTDERRELERTIAQLQRDERCVRRVALASALCAALGMAGLAYGTILGVNLPYDEARFIAAAFCSIALASLICLASFVGLLALYRRKLNKLREACRRLITRFLESHHGAGRLPPAPAGRRESGDRDGASRAAEVRGAQDGVGSWLDPAADEKSGNAMQR